MVNGKDRTYLRDLAKKQRELAHLPVMEERTRRWYDHNDLIGNDVMVYVETGTFIGDIMPKLETTGDFARGVEWKLHHTALNQQLIDDDRVIPKTYDISWHTGMKAFDLDVDTRRTDGVGYQFIHPIHDLKGEFHKLKPSRITVDKGETQKNKEMLEDLLGDILPVRLSSGSLGAGLAGSVMRLMGMEAMYLTFADYPDKFKEMMGMLVDDTLRYYRTLEGENLLHPNNGNDHLAQGSFGFTNQLPLGKKEATKTRDMWGYMDSQETEGVSPECFGEFFYPHYARIAKEYGLLSYGCCEPVHLYWDSYISKLPNLRKLSISAWCDEAFMSAALKGTQTIYHRKPSPNYIGVGADFDEDGFKGHIIKTLKAAKGCKLEISFRDIYTLAKDIKKPRRAVDIVRSLIEKYWE